MDDLLDRETSSYRELPCRGPPLPEITERHARLLKCRLSRQQDVYSAVENIPRVSMTRKSVGPRKLREHKRRIRLETALAKTSNPSRYYPPRPVHDVARLHERLQPTD